MARDIPGEIGEVSLHDALEFCNRESESGRQCERNAKRRGRYAVMYSPDFGDSFVALARFRSKAAAADFLRGQGFSKSLEPGSDWWKRSAFW